ncbi:MAG: hypothetical protein KC944_20125 [Candidatus Omnitrophica bacterium]|nr:hypothetical protein [Candidatus Omnitrophota bacterium]
METKERMKRLLEDIYHLQGLIGSVNTPEEERDLIEARLDEIEAELHRHWVRLNHISAGEPYVRC